MGMPISDEQDNENGLATEQPHENQEEIKENANDENQK